MLYVIARVDWRFWRYGACESYTWYLPACHYKAHTIHDEGYFLQTKRDGVAKMVRSIVVLVVSTNNSD